MVEYITNGYDYTFVDDKPVSIDKFDANIVDPMQKTALLRKTILHFNGYDISKYMNEIGTFYWLKELTLINCSIDNIDALPPSLEKLIVSNNNIDHIIFLPDTLKILDISKNCLTELNNLPSSLISINASYNKITNVAINDLYELKELDVSKNEIEILDNMPNNIITLNASDNKIHYINIEYMKKLNNLNLEKNNLVDIPFMHSDVQITKLNIAKNIISQISLLPNSLIELDLAGNELTEIKYLPNNLVKLVAYMNQIEKINILPSSLTYIDLSHNNLKEFNNYPPNLIFLDVSFNNIKTMNPNVPFSVDTLDISMNEITNILLFKKLNIRNIKYDDNDDTDDEIYIEFNDQFDQNDDLSWRNLTTNTIIEKTDETIQDNYKMINMLMSLDDIKNKPINKQYDRFSSDNPHLIILKNHYVV